MAQTFRAWETDQVWMLPPTVRDLVPAGHVAHFVRDTIVAQIKSNTGRQAKELSADAGYGTEDNLKELSRRHIRGYIATGRRKHEDVVAQGLPRGAGPRALAMRTRLRRRGHRSRYRLRKQTAEPVIGNLKDRNGLLASGAPAP